MTTKYFKIRLGHHTQFYEVYLAQDETTLIGLVFSDGHVETIHANMQTFVTDFDRYKEFVYWIDTAVDLLNA